jgi:hypothetical protein
VAFLFLSVVVVMSVFLPGSFSFAKEKPVLTVDFVTLDKLAEQYYQDAKRIEVYYPKQFERLEMDWDQTVHQYFKEYKSATSVEEKIHIFSRLYNSFNNAHHRALTVKGLVKYEPLEPLSLPITIFGQGIRFSKAKFFVSEISKNFSEGKLNTGDEILAYNGIPVDKYLRIVRDEVSSESPEDHINRTAQGMYVQTRCRWGKVHCWKPNEKVKIQVKDLKSGQNKEVELNWDKAKKDEFGSATETASFAPEYKGWSFKTIQGPYAPDFDSIPDPNIGFMGQLISKGKKWLVVKIFLFRDAGFVQSAIQEARKSEYEGVILDFGDNGGGDDSAMTFLAGILGTKFNLEISSIRLTKEFRDFEVLKESTFSGKKAGYLFPYIQPSNFNKMSPLMPFACLDLKCPMKTEYSDYLEYYEKPSVVTDKPVKKIALITGRGTASKADSVAALFRATKVGPIIGTPAVASSGTYYYKKDYVVPVGNNAITLSVTFTPDYSVGGDCEEVQANPPQPTVLVERTFENRKYYDTLTWIKSTEAIASWDTPSNISVKCPVETAKEKLKGFGLKEL